MVQTPTFATLKLKNLISVYGTEVHSENSRKTKPFN